MSIQVLHRQLQLSSSDDEGIAVNLKWGEEVQRLCPPLVYAAGLRKDGDEAPQDLQKMLADMNASQEAFTPSAVLRHKHNVEPYGPSHLPIMTTLVLEKPHHDKVIQAGRENGTSITGVVAGIMAMLSVRYSEEQSARSVSIWGVATDRRARLPEEYKPFYSQAIWSKSILLGNMEAIQSALQSVFGTGSINDEFWTVCRDFKADLDAFAVSMVKSLFLRLRYDDSRVCYAPLERRLELSHVKRSSNGWSDCERRHLREHTACPHILLQLWQVRYSTTALIRIWNRRDQSG